MFSLASRCSFFTTASGRISDISASSLTSEPRLRVLHDPNTDDLEACWFGLGLRRLREPAEEGTEPNFREEETMEADPSKEI